MRQIRCLIESGMPTRFVRALLPWVEGPDADMPPHESPEIAAVLLAEQARLRGQIEKLERSQQEVACYPDQVRRTDAPTS